MIRKKTTPPLYLNQAPICVLVRLSPDTPGRANISLVWLHAFTWEIIVALDISSNFAAGIANRNLSGSGNKAATSLAKLSSGKRVFAARLDAAALAVGSRLNADVQSLKQAESNAHQASNILQTAEGAFDATADILTRLKSLSVQAGSGTLSDADRVSLNVEFKELAAEIDRIAASTRINERPLDKTLALDFKVGTDGTDDTISITLDPPTTASLGVAGLSIGTQAGADAASADISAAIDQVVNRRSLIGATQNRLSFAGDNLAVAAENKEAARSGLIDLDVAHSSTQLALAEALTKAGAEALAQANNQPGQFVKLLA